MMHSIFGDLLNDKIAYGLDIKLSYVFYIVYTF